RCQTELESTRLNSVSGGFIPHRHLMLRLAPRWRNPQITGSYRTHLDIPEEARGAETWVTSSLCQNSGCSQPHYSSPSQGAQQARQIPRPPTTTPRKREMSALRRTHQETPQKRAKLSRPGRSRSSSTIPASPSTRSSPLSRTLTVGSTAARKAPPIVPRRHRRA